MTVVTVVLVVEAEEFLLNLVLTYQQGNPYL
jgi:hypothetical protein